MLYFNDFPVKEEEKRDVKLPEKVDSIHVSYDGGRLEVSVNGLVLFRNMCAGSDFGLEINKKSFE